MCVVVDYTLNTMCIMIMSCIHRNFLFYQWCLISWLNLYFWLVSPHHIMLTEFTRGNWHSHSVGLFSNIQTHIWPNSANCSYSGAKWGMWVRHMPAEVNTRYSNQEQKHDKSTATISHQNTTRKLAIQRRNVDLQTDMSSAGEIQANGMNSTCDIITDDTTTKEERKTSGRIHIVKTVDGWCCNYYPTTTQRLLWLLRVSVNVDFC